MLKRFVLNALSSFVGAWIAIGVCILGLILFGLGLFGSVVRGNSERLDHNSILKLSLQGTITENEVSPSLDYNLLLSGQIEQSQSLKSLVEGIRESKKNDNIKALFISCEGVSASPATLDVLRNEILNFKDCGKRVYAYGDNLTMGDYFVASTADVIYLNPAGSLDIQGINGTTLYYKDFLDKIGVEVQTLRVGSFKSAVEPYTSNTMSEPARQQLDTLYSEMWGYIKKCIAKQRSVSSSRLDSLVNNFIFLDKATVAKQYKLVDDCLYQREVMSIIANYVGEDVSDLNFVSPQFLSAGELEYNTDASRQIAVLYAEGEIAEYEGAGINCNKLVPLIVKLANEDRVEGMVLRVNSPGGSVFGSEQIGEALDYFKSKGKPLAVSMGAYAASGGYWISAGADRIFADPLTITGSIGIFGMVPNISNLVEMIGVHPQTVGTNPDVLFPSIFYPMNERQQQALQGSLDRGYNQFVERVAKGRNKTEEYVKSIAQGRVWSGIKAKEIGLVDELGGLKEAVDWVAKRTNLSSPNVVAYPTEEVSFLTLLQSSAALSPELKAIICRLEQNNTEKALINFTRWLLLQKPLQARSPNLIISF